MRVPDEVLADDVNTELFTSNLIGIGGKWFLARSYGFHGLMLRKRIRLAWKVFTGQYDALKWKEAPDD